MQSLAAELTGEHSRQMITDSQLDGPFE